MKNIQGNKKDGAIIKESVTWGFHVIDYKNTIGNRAQGHSFGFGEIGLRKAKAKYEEILKQTNTTNKDSF